MGGRSRKEMRNEAWPTQVVRGVHHSPVSERRRRRRAHVSEVVAHRSAWKWCHREGNERRMKKRRERSPSVAHGRKGRANDRESPRGVARTRTRAMRSVRDESDLTVVVARTRLVEAAEPSRVCGRRANEVRDLKAEKRDHPAREHSAPNEANPR